MERKKIVSSEKKKVWGGKKKAQKNKINYWPYKLTPGEQFHPIHEIPQQDFLDGALVGARSLKPKKKKWGYKQKLHGQTRAQRQDNFKVNSS